MPRYCCFLRILLPTLSKQSDAAPEQGEPHAGQEGHHLCSSSPEDAHLVLPGEHFQDLTQMVARVSRNLRLLRNTCLLEEIGFWGRNMATGWHILMTASNSWHKAQFMGCPHHGAHSGLNQAIRDYKRRKAHSNSPRCGLRMARIRPTLPNTPVPPRAAFGGPHGTRVATAHNIPVGTSPQLCQQPAMLVPVKPQSSLDKKF